MFDIGLPELLVILVVALLVFGPNKMVELGRDLGKAVRDFRRSTGDLQKEFNDALRLDEPAKPLPPRTSPLPPPPPAPEPVAEAANRLLLGESAVACAEPPPAPDAVASEPPASDTPATSEEGEPVLP
jgi:TatA/E family protein of Tat protein translocase